MSEQRSQTGSRMSGISGYSHRSLSTKETPATYVRRVFNIITLQLFVLVIMIILAGKYISIKRFFLRHNVLSIFMFIVAIMSAISLRTGVFSNQSPTNYTVFGIFNLSFNYVVCRISYILPPLSMLTFCVICLSLVTGLTLFLSSSDKHINIKYASITALASMVVGGALMLIFYEITFVKCLMCMFFGGFVAAYLIYASHLIYEGRRKSIKMDDEIMGVVSYYCDLFSVGKHLFQVDHSQEVRL